MSEENENQVEAPETQAEPTNEAPDFEALVQKAVDEQLAKIKGNLDKAYEGRDAAIKEAEELKKAKQEIEIKALEESGKATEALELRMKQQAEEMKQLMEMNTKLSRDTVVREALAALDFSGEKAAGMAANDITSQLTKDVNGNWVGPEGLSISQVVEAYSQDESNAFLFKAKLSQGAKSVPQQGQATPTNPSATKSIKDMSAMEYAQALQDGSMEFSDNNKWF